MNRPVFVSLTDEDGVLIERLQLDPESFTTNSTQLMEHLRAGYEKAQRRRHVVSATDASEGQCSECGAGLVYIQGPNVTAAVCPVCDRDASALNEDEVTT